MQVCLRCGSSSQQQPGLTLAAHHSTRACHHSHTPPPTHITTRTPSPLITTAPAGSAPTSRAWSAAASCQTAASARWIADRPSRRWAPRGAAPNRPPRRSFATGLWRAASGTPPPQRGRRRQTSAWCARGGRGGRTGGPAGWLGRRAGRNTRRSSAALVHRATSLASPAVRVSLAPAALTLCCCPLLHRAPSQTRCAWPTGTASSRGCATRPTPSSIWTSASGQGGRVSEGAKAQPPGGWGVA